MTIDPIPEPHVHEQLAFGQLYVALFILAVVLVVSFWKKLKKLPFIEHTMTKEDGKEKLQHAIDYLREQYHLLEALSTIYPEYRDNYNQKILFIMNAMQIMQVLRDQYDHLPAYFTPDLFEPKQ